MWNTWVEKAKQAAENIDRQLNESVGAEVPAGKPAVVTATENGEGGVWNDDDFKFDDDDDDAQQEAAPEAVAEEKPTTSENEEAPPQGGEAGEGAATAPSPNSAPPDTTTEVSTPPKGVAESPHGIVDNTKSWATEDDQNFENFFGVTQTEPTGASSPEQKEPPNNESMFSTPAPPSAKKESGLGFGGFPVKLGGLTNTVKLASKVNEINFMSPFSSVMTSISQDQDEGTQEPPKEEEKDKDTLPTEEDPKTLEENPSDVSQEKLNKEADTRPSIYNDAQGASWQEDDDIEFDDEDINDNNKVDEDASKEDADASKDKAAETGATPEKEIAEETTSKDEDAPGEKQQEEKKAAEEEPSPEEVPSPEEEPPKEDEPVVEEVKAEPEQSSNDSESKGAPDEGKIDSEQKREPPQPPAATPETAEKSPVGTEASEIAESSPAGPSVSSAELEQVKTLLAQREEQLAAKAEQMFQLQQMYENEKQELQKKLADTKEEAKKRIMKARERCETAEAKLQASTSALTDDAAQQAQLVAALRQEGEKLAHKQSAMEQTVRAARGEARELREALDEEITAKENALDKIEKLQVELKSTQEQLSSARKGETQAGKLDADLQAAKEEISLKSNSIMTLEQNVKELKAENKELFEEVEAARQGAAVDSANQIKKLRKDHNTAIADLESKLQTSEREAAIREDSLRREVEELRKRWQDAVRRADALSMDVQSSTAPLLRQLESMERQHRARASAAAELENKLRAELEETVIQNEKLSKEHTEIKMKNGRLERQTKEQQNDLEERQKTIDELTSKITRLEDKLQKMETEGEKKKEEWAEVERLANEGVSKVRSEMSQAVLESEERYRSQLETMKEELRIEQEKRNQLEQQVDNLLDNAAMILPSVSNEYVKEAKPKNLKQSEGQAEILSSALLGLSGDSQDDDDNDSDDGDAGAPTLQHQTSTASSSFAALEHLTQNLKAAKKELETLRKRLAESEKTRESLLEELGESRDAKEKLPLFEAKVKDLMADNKEKELEIRGLQDDIAEVREMYRMQMNLLLEEKAAAFAEVAKAAGINGNRINAAPSPPVEEEEEEKMPELVEDMLGI